MSDTGWAGAVRCMWMRGGTSKGGFFLGQDLPDERAARDRFLLRVMGSPDARQIDGIGGGDPLTSKVAVVRKSTRRGVDVDYLFLQVFVDQALVTDAQNCGNILAGVGAFAIERGLVSPNDGITPVTVFMENTQQIATLNVQTPAGHVCYAGDARIDGVPGTAAPVPITFRDTAGSSCGALLPTGRAVDEIDGIPATLIDNGMPVVVLRADDLNVDGGANRESLDRDQALKVRLESIRLQAGPLMNLGDVKEKSVPKMTLISPPQQGGAISTRTFIPHRCHAAIGVLGAVSVASACLIKGTPTAAMAQVPEGASKTLSIEHPSGETTVVVDLAQDGAIASAAILRTARKLFDGTVFSE
ncbi:4-oxalomesaconate tautomerase [Tropicibacter sp. Alg240-R139]|uniref:4-oxalomesaconate tautomerase n=1 Tax=Tropicibacter sp. Alg240-R139 TaxID=2305991 RepID=UPI0013E04B48|nr:4-oxalomesaconate tautomerase [Tropicibacter sp. Alg240-R139]